MMLGQWAFFLAAGQAPEIQSAPIALAHHLAAEAATVAALIVCGVAALREVAQAQHHSDGERRLR